MRVFFGSSFSCCVRPTSGTVFFASSFSCCAAPSLAAVAVLLDAAPAASAVAAEFGAAFVVVVVAPPVPFETDILPSMSCPYSPG